MRAELPVIQIRGELDATLVRYVEYTGMGHVEPMDGMELAWEHCFSRYRRTEHGIQRIRPADDIVTAPVTFALADGGDFYNKTSPVPDRGYLVTHSVPMRSINFALARRGIIHCYAQRAAKKCDQRRLEQIYNTINHLEELGDVRELISLL